MPKGNKRKGQAEAPVDFDVTPSEDCKKFLVEFIARFYEDNTVMALESKYLRYKEESVDKFKRDMANNMQQALHVPRWIAETEKRGFTKFLDQRVHDSLWNAKNVLTKYGKEHRDSDETFYEQVILKVELFVELMRPFAKRKNRKDSITSWNSTTGGFEERLMRQQLVALPETATVVELERRTLRGGYATIKRVRIEGAPGIERHWEFAAKLSNQQSTRPDLAKLEHQNESMAVRISHPGVIRYVAIHAHKYEGYAYWWNGGTLRQMFNLDNAYGDDIYARTLHAPLAPEDVIEADRLCRFRKKRTELAWAFVIIMSEVHMSNNLHNDISPDNILLHFPLDESRVYIGVCDWGMTTFASEPMRSMYTFTSAAERNKTLAERWWVDPTIAYLHKRDADVEVIPQLTKTSEAYAVAKIAIRINKGNMSENYWKLQKVGETSVRFQRQELADVFGIYLNRLCTSDRDRAGGLSHIVTRFRDTYNWPVPYEHFRSSY